MSLTVACVLWRGPNARRDYRPEHVSRLRDMVARHLTVPHRVVCLSNWPVPCERIPLVTSREGWWAKTELLRPDLFTGRVLYLDLDVTIIDNIDEIAAYPGQFVTLRDWLTLGFNSSVMLWDAGIADHLYRDLTLADMNRLHGDQDWLTERFPSAATFPRSWVVSYKANVRPKGRVPDGAKVIVWHGVPKPWQLPAGHFMEKYEEAA